MEWISVKDRLPNERIMPVLAFNGTAPIYNQHVFQATWFGQDKYFLANDRALKYLGEITHWMPLPEPPNL